MVEEKQTLMHNSADFHMSDGREGNVFPFQLSQIHFNPAIFPASFTHNISPPAADVHHWHVGAQVCIAEAS